MTTRADRVWVRQEMGLPWSTHVRGPGAHAAEVDVAVERVHTMLRAVDRRFSTYRRDSEVSALRRGLRGEGEASPQLAEVLRMCREATQATGGAFDAWLPGPDGVRRLDPSGLVKGWALRRAGRLLAGLPGVEAYVSGGGDVVAVGDPDVVTGWVVGVQDPRDPARVLARLRLVAGGAAAAVATSGTYARGAHLLDPRTGSPLPGLVSATVVGPDALQVDVLATALAVDGVRALPDLERAGCQGLLVGETPGAGVRTTSGWPGLPA